MAAVTVVKAKSCTPVGYEVNDAVALGEAVVAGDLLNYSGATSNGQAVVMRAAITGITEAAGIALQDGYSGQNGFSMGVQGEMDGYSGLIPGAPLYPSTATAGKLDTTAITGAAVRVRAVTATRIRFNFT